jgi:hypothetical protein
MTNGQLNSKIKIILITSAILLISGCAKQPELVILNLNVEPPAKSATATAVQSTTTKQQVRVPNTFELPVAFASQAPLSNWDALHEEACEEASMIMADKYFTKQPLSVQIMEAGLQKLVKWETDQGYKVDVTATETAKILNDYFNLTARVTADVSVDRIKYEISQGNLIIIPAAGRLLGNPNFTGQGPIYHMLVVKGYNDREFITNDPGTRKGNGYKYDYQTLLNAIHDWNPALVTGDTMTDANMAKGAKVMVVVDKS